MRGLSDLYLAYINKPLLMILGVTLITLGASVKTHLYDDCVVLFKAIHLMFMGTKVEIVHLESTIRDKPSAWSQSAFNFCGLSN